MNYPASVGRDAIPSGVQHRFLAAGLDAQPDGTLRATLSSETPVERLFGNEVLVHTPEAVNLARAAMGLPLLLDHDPGQQVGRVENIRLEGRKLVGDIRLTERADMAGIVADVRNGIRPDISIGYIIDANEPGTEPGTVIVTRWTLIEVSSVTIPADHTVGVGRSLTPSPRRTLSMNTNPNPALVAAVNAHEAAMATHAERQRTANITAMGNRLGIDQATVARAIEEGWTVDTLANSFRSGTSPAQPLRLAEGAGGSDAFDREVRAFSLVRAIASMVENGRLEGREAEVSQELVRRSGGIAPKGILVPTATLSTRTQVVGTAGSAGNLVGNDFHPEAFIPPLRNASVVMQMGCTVLPGLIGNAILPRQDNATGGAWVAEDAAPSETNLSFSQLTLTPKTVSGNISWSRQAALQALPAMEEIVRADLSAQLGIALDRAAIAGSGSSNEPRGILNTAGIGSVALGTNGGAPSLDAMIDLETAVTMANAGIGNLSYLTNDRMRGKLKKTEEFSGTGTQVWGKDNRVNGYAAFSSQNVPSNLTKGTGTGLSAMIFGNWAELVIGLWGALDLIVDPYTYSTQGRVRISAFLSADISVKHAASFAAITDAVA